MSWLLIRIDSGLPGPSKADKKWVVNDADCSFGNDLVFASVPPLVPFASSLVGLSFHCSEALFEFS